MNDELKEQILQIIADNITLNVETTSEYTGGVGIGLLYKDSHKIQLMLDGEVISECYL